jgi:hypothetical protein
VTAVVFDLDDTLYEEKGPKVAAECAVAAGLAIALDVTVAEALAVFLAAKREVLDRRELGPARNERQRWISHALASRAGDGHAGLAADDPQVRADLVDRLPHGDRGSPHLVTSALVGDGDDARRPRQH